MRTNIELDEKLLSEAKKLSKLTTNKAVVNQALNQYVQMLKRKDMLNLFGKVKWEGNLDEMRQA